MWMFFDRNARVFNGALLGSRGFPEMQTTVSKEHVKDLAGHVESREQRTRQPEIKRKMRNGPLMRRMKNFIFAPETRKEKGHATERHHTNRVGGKRDRHVFAQSTHPAYVLFLVTAVNHRASAHE